MRAKKVAAETSIPALPPNVSEPLPIESAPRANWFSRFLVIGIFGLPLALIVIAFLLARIEPSFYTARLCENDIGKRHQLSSQFLNVASRLISDIQNSSAWEAEFGETQVNGWLAEDFEQNHASKSLPEGISDPRIAIDGDLLRLAFRCQKGPLSTVIQIGARAWVPRRNLLAVELEAAQAGMLPLPTTYTRKVIEQVIQAQNLDISWKRNGNKLVALIDFSRNERVIVLRKVEIRPEGLFLEGLSGGHGLQTRDYAPTAN